MQGQKIGYVRVSTIEQNTIRQLDGLNLDKVFTDRCSGKDTERPALNDLIDFVREGDIIYIHSMDRLARNLFDLQKLVHFFNNKKIKVQFIKENMIFSSDTDSPMANLTLAMLGAFAEFERALIHERQKEGIAIARQSNTYKGRKPIFTNEQQAEIKQMVADRYKVTEIAKKFNVSRATIYNYLASKD